MAISITTLNTEGGSATTWVETGKDKTSAEWFNTTQGTASNQITLGIKQSLQGKTISGNPIRRTLISAKHVIPVNTVVNGNTVSVPESFIVNLTITGPNIMSSLTQTQMNDLLAYVRNFATAANLAALRRGEV